MQHPVGYVLNHQGQPELNNVGALFTNPTFLWGYVHVILASLVTGSLVMLAISAWYLRKQREVEAFHQTARLSVLVLLPAILLQMFVGNKLGEIETTYQPVKIAAAEAQWENCKPCSFSAFQVGGGQKRQDPDPDHRDPAPALDPRDRDLGWRGRGAEPAAEGRRQEIRARQLHPRCVHPVLVDARDGLPRVADRAAGAMGRLARPQGHARRARSGSCVPGWGRS